MLCLPYNNIIENAFLGEYIRMTEQKSPKQIRFEKEAKALQKNIAKRKKQQQELNKIKQEKEKNRGQD